MATNEEYPGTGPEGAHPSFVLDVPSQEGVEEVWRTYWAPLVEDGGLARLKGELYDYFHLVTEARKVYRHVTGGLTDDLTASAEGIIALADNRVGELTEALRQRVTTLQAERDVLVAKLKARGV
jgi:hypothetical protein